MTAKRFAVTLAYDGTDFIGSQLQREGRTVQGECEQALAALFGQQVRFAMAGRTDTGVHARGQVGAFTVTTALEAGTVQRALNAHLPFDVRVRNAAEAPAGFDPRRWARSRTYEYSVDTEPVGDPLRRRYAWNAGSPLDADAMREASASLIGQQDFAAVAGAVPEGKSTEREIMRADWVSQRHGLMFSITGNAFLPHMVRMIVGALVRVGRGALPAGEFRALLHAAQPGSLGPAAPAHGLCLERVKYDKGYRE